jgi:2-polyprenyl-6-methoxyphenol hydroxylase-like FAD-dependent oxidoreductase
VGGSLAGLFTANALSTAGWRVDVFERSAHRLQGRGGGLVIQQDVVDAMQFAGIDTGELGIRSDDRIVLDAGGQVVYRAYLPQTQTSWSVLYARLHDALPAGVIHPGERLSSFTELRAEVTCQFESGRVETADLLIGADGALSSVREVLLPGVAPRYAGYVAWRGLTPELALPAAAAQQLGNAFVFQEGAAHQLLAYRVPGADHSMSPGERRWNWVWFRKVPAGEPLRRLLVDRDGNSHAQALAPGAVKPGDIEELRSDASAMLAPSLRDLVLNTAEPFIQAIVDLGAPRMVVGRTVLVGDAAFVPRPHTAGGAARAAANASSLAQALSAGTEDIDRRLAQWEAGQLRQGHALVANGVALGHRIMGPSP